MLLRTGFLRIRYRYAVNFLLQCLAGFPLPVCFRLQTGQFLLFPLQFSCLSGYFCIICTNFFLLLLKFLFLLFDISQLFCAIKGLCFHFIQLFCKKSLKFTDCSPIGFINTGKLAAFPCQQPRKITDVANFTFFSCPAGLLLNFIAQLLVQIQNFICCNLPLLSQLFNFSCNITK